MNSPGKYKSLDLQVARDKLYHIVGLSGEYGFQRTKRVI